MQSGGPIGIGSTGSNHPTPNPFYEQGETSNSFQSRRAPSRRNKKKPSPLKPSPLTSKRQIINEEFKPKNLFLQVGIFSKFDCVTDIRKALEAWKSAMVLNLLYEPVYPEEGSGRDVTAICSLIINSFQGIVYSLDQGLSPNILNLFEIDVQRNLITGIEEGIRTMVKYLIGQFEGYEYVDSFIHANLENRHEALYLSLIHI